MNGHDNRLTVSLHDVMRPADAIDGPSGLLKQFQEGLPAHL